MRRRQGGDCVLLVRDGDQQKMPVRQVGAATRFILWWLTVTVICPYTAMSVRFVSGSLLNFGELVR